MKKQCFKCKETKEHTEFYKHKQMSDGLLGKCKLCTKSDTKKRTSELLKDPKWHDKEKARHRDKYYRLGYKEKHKPTPEMKKTAMAKHLNKYPEKYKAKCVSGHLKSPKGMEKHHWSYDIVNAKDVIFLSNKDHSTAHRFLKYNQPEKLYYTLDGIKLDTREKHQKYINIILSIELN